jgi:hypothetical protein
VRRASAIFGMFLACAGCSDDSATPPRDGSLPDATAPEEDLDGDGVCNDTEMIRGTDGADPDSDDDGFSDFVELMYGYDANRPAEPARDIIVLLREEPAATTELETETEIVGEGEDYTGAFMSLGVVGDIGGARASDFFASSRALFATPDTNVGLVEPEASRFRAVVGRTRLAFQLQFAFADELPRGCARPYPFRWDVKRSDGPLVSAQTYLLVVLPIGAMLEGDNWCVSAGTCR